MKKILLVVAILLVLIQLITPAKTNPKVDSSIALKTSMDVERILKKSCYDCHSFETKWRSYANIAPFSWLIVSHVEDGRKALNFSKWSEIDHEIKEKRLRRVIQTTSNGMMPLSSYVSFHEEAKLSVGDKKVLRDWVNTQLEILKNN